jgi:hypothetical protein
MTQPVKWPGGARCAIMMTFDFNGESSWIRRDPALAGRPLHMPMGAYGPMLARGAADLGAFVRFGGSLDMRVRVLAAMTVARELDAVYVWGPRWAAPRRLGVLDASIAAIREKHSCGIPPEDAQIVEFTRQLMRTHRVDDATTRALHERSSDDGFIQLTGLAGTTACCPAVPDTRRRPQPPATPPPAP